MTFQLPGYEVTHLLGFGASGEVWLARDRSTGDEVALKRLRLGGGAIDRDRLRREAVALGAIDHPHLLRLRAVLASGEDLALVLDYAAGGSLAALLATRGALDPGEVVTLATPIAEALSAVHGRSVVHGDVSPGNVLFTLDGRPMLADLGVARLAGEGRPTVEGTPGYVDPAVRRGGVPTSAADVYALGALCVAALTGQVGRPDNQPDFSAADPVTAPAALRDLLALALDEDPGGRPTAAEFAAALYDAARPLPVRLPDGSLAERGAAVLAETPVTRRVLRPGPAAGRGASGRLGTSPEVATAESSGLPRVGRRKPGRHEHAAQKHGLRHRRRPHLGAAMRRAMVPVAVALALLAGATGTGLVWAHASAPRATALSSSSKRPDSSHAARRSPATPATPAGVSAPPTHSALPGRLGPSVPGHAGRALPAVPGDTPASQPPTGAPVQAWLGVLNALDAARASAFAAGRPAGLTAVYAPGAPAGSRDRSSLERLTAAGLRARNLRLHTTQVLPVRSSGLRMQLRVRDAMDAYDVIDESGAVVERHAGRGEALWSITLVRVGGGWRVWDVAHV